MLRAFGGKTLRSEEFTVRHSAFLCNSHNKSIRQLSKLRPFECVVSRSRCVCTFSNSSQKLDKRLRTWGGGHRTRRRVLQVVIHLGLLRGQVSHHRLLSPAGWALQATGAGSELADCGRTAGPQRCHTHADIPRDAVGSTESV